MARGTSVTERSRRFMVLMLSALVVALSISSHVATYPATAADRDAKAKEIALRQAVQLKAAADLRMLEKARRAPAIAAVDFRLVAAREIMVWRVAPTTSTATDTVGGAALKTDPELERLLKRADQFAADKRYDLAIVLWQKVLDESGDIVMTRENWKQTTFAGHEYAKYRSVSEEIERTLASLPALGLKIYRLKADGQAKAVLAAGKGSAKEQALAEVVRRFFLSSVGDDAAFELACLHMERHEFVGASRLLSKILSDYPNSSVSTREILVRLALANSQVGDRRAAESVLAKLRKVATTGYSRRVVALVEKDVSRGISLTGIVPNEKGQWHMIMGTPNRKGHMGGLRTDATSSDMSESWSYALDVSLNSKVTTNARGSQNMIVFGGGFRSGRIQSTNNVTVNLNMLDRWKKGDWKPAGQMLFDSGLVYFKQKDRLVCVNSSTGEMVWMGRPNVFDVDPITRYTSSMRRMYNNRMATTKKPTFENEVQLFGDRVFQSMTIFNGRIYCLEGELVDPDEGSAFSSVPTTTVRPGYGQAIPRRTRRNYIAAYDAANGKFKWRRTAHADKKDKKFDIGFIGAPVPYANRLLIPVSDGGELWMYALSLDPKQEGKIVWRSYLCDEPEGGCSQWSPVGVSVDGGDCYVATGAGAIFAIDAISGTIRWAVRYQRTGVVSNQFARFGNVGKPLDLRGFDDDVVIPHGRQLVVMASDYDHIFSVDRRTGEFLWDSPQLGFEEAAPAEYCLGMLGDNLYVAGKTSIRQYDVPSGRLLKEAYFDDEKSKKSYGRGVLTESAIYLPVEGSVLILDPKNIENEIGQVGVILPSNEPVGNLFSDGNRLLVAGLGRVYALTDLKYRMSELSVLIKAGNADAQLERMRLRNRLGDRAKAIVDLRGAYQLILKKTGPIPASQTMFSGIRELKLTNSDPKLTLELLIPLPSTLKDVPAEQAKELDKVNLQRRSLVLTSYREITSEKLKGATSVILDSLPSLNLESRGQFMVAQHALVGTVGPADAELLRTTLKSKDQPTRMLATFGLDHVLGDDALPVMQGLLKDSQDGVKLVAAVSIVNRGVRDPMTNIVELLTSSDVMVQGFSVQALRSAFPGQWYGYTPGASPLARSDAATNWQNFVAANLQKVELKLPIRLAQPILGRTLITIQNRNKIIELNREKKVTWQVTLAGATGCQGLPNGHRLISSYQSQQIIEYDSKDKVVWTLKAAGRPYSVRRLENGNTLVACYSTTGTVIEYRPDKSIHWQVKLKGPIDAKRLENGNTLVCLLSASKVVEVDHEGKEVWFIRTPNNPRSAQRLDNGNTLVALSGSGKVVEYDRTGKVIWEMTGLSSPTDAQRLENGNTLIMHSRGTIEVDANKQTKWSYTKTTGSGRISRF